MRILILDIGTTSMRGILYDENGTQLALTRKENHLVFMGDTLIEENPRDFYDNTVAIIRAVTDQTGLSRFDAIGITSQRSSIIPVDRQGNPLSAAIMWQDTRNREICRKLEAYNPMLYERTGAQVSTVFSGSKMTWIRHNQPEIYKDTYKFLNIPEYVVMCMTGEFVTDTTYASRTGLMDLRTSEWDPEILKLYDVEEEKLCRKIEPGETAGYVTEAFARVSCIDPGIPVIHCGGDQQCAAIGHGIIEKGPVSLTVGTGGFLAAALDELPEMMPSGVIINRASSEHQFIMEANILSCGAGYDWCARELYGMEKADYRFLESELKKENFVSSPLVIPYFSGRGAPDWNPLARAVFSGITTATRRSELFKSIMESIFMEIANHLEHLSEVTEITRVYAGGGMTASKTLNQLMANIFGREVDCVENPEATGLGALAVVLAAGGQSASVKEAYRALAGEKKIVYTPDMTLHEAYEAKREKMNRLYEIINQGGGYES
ncbi:MAG: FGGY-family carbohydrate kinase [Erysipelotrichaceae bacterium]|nr:FGGY-family carbohydrate kinase [Erysipelotrichaceae bacterium]